MKKYTKITSVFFVSLALLVITFILYTNDYYKASDYVYETLKSENISVSDDKGMIIFKSKAKSDTGFVFYPGGKVDYKAYIPLMDKLSKKGITSILIKMPFNLAVFDKDAAEVAFKELPEINNWYVGGHSLGGAMASDFVSKEKDEKIKGLILMAAYPVGDLYIPELVIYGSQDLVLSKEKLNSSLNMLEIEGGNHAYFGDYGEQKGDGLALISREEQQRITLEAVVDFIGKQDKK